MVEIKMAKRTEFENLVKHFETCKYKDKFFNELLDCCSSLDRRISTLEKANGTHTT